MFEHMNTSMTLMHGTGMMFFWLIVILVLFLLFFNNRTTDKSSIILRERFAKGEITKEEYDGLKNSL